MLTSNSIIAVDIDDVIADGTNALIESANKRYDLTLTHHDYHNVGGDFKGYYERVWLAHGVGDIVNYDDLAEEMIVDQSNIPLLAGAEFAINELSKRYEVVLITARPVTWRRATERWLNKNLPEGNIQLYFAGNHHDEKAMSKGEQAKKLGVSLLIDDNIANCQSALDEGLEAILFGDYGWQKAAPVSMTRCRDWPAVLDYLDEA